MIATSDMELSRENYEARQRHEVSRAALERRAASVRRGGRFSRREGAWTHEPYVGHAVVSMVAGDVRNQPLQVILGDVVHELREGFADDESIYLLPGASWHQTVANTLSDDRHHAHVVAPGLEREYPARVSGALGKWQPRAVDGVVKMQMLGLSIFSTAIGLLGVFENDIDFERILGFRDHFYGDPEVAALGIRRTRPFIGHVTVAYIEAELDVDARRRLVEVVDGINRSLASRHLVFHMPIAELRAYDHLAEFRALTGLPVARL